MTAAVGNINLKYLLKTAPVTDYTCLSWKNYRGTTNPETIKNMKIQKFELKKEQNLKKKFVLLFLRYFYLYLPAKKLLGKKQPYENAPLL